MINSPQLTAFVAGAPKDIIFGFRSLAPRAALRHSRKPKEYFSRRMSAKNISCVASKAEVY